MMLLPCPWCGSRNEAEFVNGGDANKHRPAASTMLSDAQWCDYVYLPANTKGWLREYWWHWSGCRRWFALDRHTVTHALRVAADPNETR